MKTTTVRVHVETRDKLRELAELTGRAMPDLLADSVVRLERELFFDRANVAFAALRANPEAWRDELEERVAWDTTLMDDLDDPADD